MARPLTARKLDLIYLVFFIIHLPIMFFDLAPLYPASIRPEITVSIRNWYIANYRDRFFIAPPGWFYAFTVLEAVYHLPLSLWAVRALINDDPMVPVQLLVFATETAITTLTCAVEVTGWEGYTQDEVSALMGLYLPYLGLSIVMGVDMFLRLREKMSEHARLVEGKKRD